MTRTAEQLLFQPRSVVVYGASSDPDKLSGRPLAYLLKFGYAGRLFAVNPRHSQVQGVGAYPAMAAVPEPVDLAVIVVPAPSVLAAVRDCAQAGVGAAIIFASGFAETDQAGASAQAELVAAAGSMRVLGPNCLGVFGAPANAFATFSTAFDDDQDLPDSPIALVSQSGAVGTFTYSNLTSVGLGVRYYANTGNECDLTVVEILGDLIRRDDLTVLLGHIEGVKDSGALADLSRLASRLERPLLMLKAGRTVAGERAVAKHTASVAGDDHAFDEAIAGGGIIRVDSMEDWADAALVFASGRRARGRRLSIVTLSGGAGAIAADAAVQHGLVVDTWTRGHDRDTLASSLPAFASVANPIDLTGAMINDIGLLETGLDITIANAETDAVLVVLGNADKGADDIVATVIGAARRTDKPLLVSWTGGSGRPLRALLDAGVPAYADPSRAVRALSRLTQFSLRAKASNPPEPALQH